MGDDYNWNLWNSYDYRACFDYLAKVESYRASIFKNSFYENMIMNGILTPQRRIYHGFKSTLSLFAIGIAWVVDQQYPSTSYKFSIESLYETNKHHMFDFRFSPSWIKKV